MQSMILRLKSILAKSTNLSNISVALLIFVLAIGFYLWNKQITCKTELKSMYFSDDFQNGVNRGRACSNMPFASPMVKAWTAAHEARGAAIRDAELRTAKLILDYPLSGEANFAKAAILIHDRTKSSEAIESARRAAYADPKDENFQWIYADTLRLRGNFKKSADFLDGNKLIDESALLLGERALVVFDVSKRKGYQNFEIREALSYTERAQNEQADVPRPMYVTGLSLIDAGKFRLANIYLRRASKLSYSPAIWGALWEALRKDTSLSLSQRLNKIHKDINDIENAGQLNSQLVRSAQFAILSAGDQAAGISMGTNLIKKYPNSFEAMEERVSRIRQRIYLAKQTSNINSPQFIKLAAELEEIAINRSGQVLSPGKAAAMEGLLLQIYLASQGSQGLDLAQIARLARVITLVEPSDPTALITAAEALSIANAPASAVKSYVTEAVKANLKQISTLDVPQNSKRELRQSFLSDSHAVLGGDDLRRNNLKSARNHMMSSVALYGQSLKALDGMGRVEIASSMPSQGREWFLRCLAINEAAPNCREGLAITEGIPTSRSDLIKQSLHKYSQVIRSLQNSMLEDEENLGRYKSTFLNIPNSKNIPSKPVTIVTFWGEWCAACKSDLPRLFDYIKTASNTDKVEFILIDDGRDTEGASNWIKSLNAPINTISSPETIKNANIGVFPTTLFLNKDHNIIYRIEGVPVSLFAEYNQRINKMLGRR